MSLRRGAPYADRIEDQGRTLIYEGHDLPRSPGGPDPKTVDQPATRPSGRPTQNGLFYEAAQRHKEDGAAAELVRVYEKIKTGIWAYAGTFRLVDAWREGSDGRKVFKFRLEVTNEPLLPTTERSELDHNRMIPTTVKVEVWRRDHGQCVKCGSSDNLHFDHDIPYSKGGSSLTAENVQLLCARHNLSKGARLQ